MALFCQGLLTRPGAGALAAVLALALLPSGAAQAANACVADPMRVATRAASPTMEKGRLPPALVTRLDAAARAAFAETASPGVIVGVRSPAGTWTAAYGKADTATGAPMTAGMHTRIGSMTKTFIGALLLQLAEAGKLSLDDPIANYVAGVPNGDRITLRMLADMTSGVASYTFNSKWTEIFETRPETVFTPDQLLAFGLQDSPLFAPGARYDYSNTNYVLLGLVIEKVTGKPIDAVLQDNIFASLKLANTSWPGQSTAIPAPYAHGYTLQGRPAPKTPVDATHWNPSWTGAAGTLISNMGDLLVYGRAMGTGQGLVSPQTQVARLTSFPEPPGFYGIGIACKDGWVGHQGELAGYNTIVFYETNSDTTVVVQTNTDISSGDCKDDRTLPGNARGMRCSTPALRLFVGLAEALGHPFVVSGK